ncbi:MULTISPECIES: response regulator transcription factor [unclassified Frigoribacterium]|uniref:response regulator n=1 Tax=unclassified Frigoribacterium TaxID=2627005 RepID=UPI0006FE30A3|nr:MULTISPECIES: response regulator transcription factor [unclassified Frigoribacterium]KQO48382.1 two-component system response regulator [Frigoribacterium sp. Leaf254]KQT40473.1 two-component system response regulator [Frigoribacterium sp. Leaf415]
MIRVVLVDDQAIVRTGFRVVLETAGGIEVVGEASGGREAVEVVRRTRPDVVVMDVRMPGGDGIEATRAIVDTRVGPGGAGTAAAGGLGSSAPLGSGPALGGGPPLGSGPALGADAVDGQEARVGSASAPAVLVATTFDLDEYVFGALEAGASGFVLKDVEPDEFVGAVRALASGRAAIDGATTRRVIAEFTRRRRTSAVEPSPDVLTERERELVRLLGEGLSNDEIGERLVVETSTVKSHLTRITTKLGTRDRLQTVVWAYRSGLLP